MKWIKLTIDTTTEAVDMISYMLGEMGIEGIEVIDHVPLSEEDRKKMYVDLLPDEIHPDDGLAKVTCYVEEDKDKEELTKEINEGLDELVDFVNLGARTLTFGETDEEDWVNNWKQYFKPFKVDDNIVIKPTWETYEKASSDDIIVEIDPGTAFGTGSHQTTQLCISQLKKYIKEDTTILDVGCGSGILSIISIMLGAKSAYLTDIDPNAIRATLENCEVNHIKVPEQIIVQEGNLLEEEAFREQIGYGKYNIVVANILADVIIPLSALVTPFLTEDGVFITSGIINTKEEEVKEALLKNSFEILEITRKGEWVSITAKPKKG